MRRPMVTFLAALSSAGLVACASGGGDGGSQGGGGSTGEVRTTSSTGATSTTLPAGAPRAGEYAAKLPLFALEDPRGNRHDEQSLLQQGGLVMLVSAPIRSSGEDQEQWSLVIEATAPPGSRWVLVEDLSQSWMKGQAEKRLKEEFDPTRPPLILLDRDGSFRKSLGVEEGKTVLLGYDEEGRLRRFEAGRPDPEAARRVWSAVR